jgi:hypothetical protein
MSIVPIAMVAAGVVLIVWPRPLSRPIVRRRAERLERLRAGAEESYLDERRAREAYPWVGGPGAFRAVGILLLVIGLFNLLPPYVPSQGP